MVAMFVFISNYDINNGSTKWITLDMFDTDQNDNLVEHWDVIAKYLEPSEIISGNDKCHK